MRIGTTPTHLFTVPMDTKEISSVEITYCQNEKVILQKFTKDCKLQGREISVTLSQMDTFKFDKNENVEIQIRFKDEGGTVYSGDIHTVSCYRCLSNRIIE